MKLIKFIADSYNKSFDEGNGNVGIGIFGALGLITFLLIVIVSFTRMEISGSEFRVMIIGLLFSTLPLSWYYIKLKEEDND